MYVIEDSTGNNLYRNICDIKSYLGDFPLVVLATDGSCFKEGGKNKLGYAVVSVDGLEKAGSTPESVSKHITKSINNPYYYGSGRDVLSNNKYSDKKGPAIAELLAIKMAFDQMDNGSFYHICTDNKFYILQNMQNIDSIERIMLQEKKSGNKVEYKAWRSILESIKDKDLKFTIQYIKAHSSNSINNVADMAACLCNFYRVDNLSGNFDLKSYVVNQNFYFKNEFNLSFNNQSKNTGILEIKDYTLGSIKNTKFNNDNISILIDYDKGSVNLKFHIDGKVGGKCNGLIKVFTCDIFKKLKDYGVEISLEDKQNIFKNFSSSLYDSSEPKINVIKEQDEVPKSNAIKKFEARFGKRQSMGVRD